jgi:hypothetical protein
MRMTLAVAVLLLAVFPLAAATITAVEPPTMTEYTPAQQLTIYGSGLGEVVHFEGRKGVVDARAESVAAGSITLRVPPEVSDASGFYSIVVSGPEGDSNTVSFEVKPRWSSLVLLIPDPVVYAVATTPKGAYVTFEVIPFGGLDSDYTVRCDPESGSFFKLGPTEVSCVAWNRSAERAFGNVSVFVYDAEAPVMHLPERISVEAENADGAVVTFEATAEDGMDGPVPVTCSPASGSRFPIGVTMVECYASDSAFNPGYGTFEVEVKAPGDDGGGDGDHGTLVIHVPADITAEAEGAGGTQVTFTVTADGSDDSHPSIACQPESGSLFPLGATTVQCTATDTFGDRAEGSFVVRVIDTTPPLIDSLTADPSVLSPPNHKLVDVTITVEARDLYDAMPQCSVVTVAANEPVNGPGSGHTDLDWMITGPLTLQLRAERSGQGIGRIYTVYVTCADTFGNEFTGTVAVTVPKGNDDPGGGSATVVTTPSRRRAVGKP